MNVFLPHLYLLFPRSGYYRQCFVQNEMHESMASFHHFPYRERHLQCLWADARHRPAQLKTTDGESVLVEHPGDWNLESGPDFLNAVLLVGKERRRIAGDLEIHIHPAAWHQHGHANNPAFSDVRFHVVYFTGEEIPGLLQIPLREVLATDPAFSFENIDISAYPYSVPSGGFPLRSMDPDRKTEWLESAGEERLRLKAERLALAMQSKDPDQVLWEEQLAALGYKNNKAPFRRLGSLLPLARLRAHAKTPDEAYSMLLGLSGLLPTNADPAWPMETRKFIRDIWDNWWRQPEEFKETALDSSDWKLAGIRPANHPVRRLMAAAYFAFRIPDLANNETLLTRFPDNFWTTHLNWKAKCPPTALVGQARANAIVTNILVPFRAATGRGELHLDRLPTEPSNSVIRQTAYTLFGPDHSQKVYRSALARQGLVQVFHDYVVTRRLEELREICS